MQLLFYKEEMWTISPILKRVIRNTCCTSKENIQASMPEKIQDHSKNLPNQQQSKRNGKAHNAYNEVLNRIANYPIAFKALESQKLLC
jgi:hypothetical protein